MKTDSGETPEAKKRSGKLAKIRETINSLYAQYERLSGMENVEVALTSLKRKMLTSFLQVNTKDLRFCEYGSEVHEAFVRCLKAFPKSSLHDDFFSYCFSAIKREINDTITKDKAMNDVTVSLEKLRESQMLPDETYQADFSEGFSAEEENLLRQGLTLFQKEWERHKGKKQRKMLSKILTLKLQSIVSNQPNIWSLANEYSFLDKSMIEFILQDNLPQMKQIATEFGLSKAAISKAWARFWEKVKAKTGGEVN